MISRYVDMPKGFTYNKSKKQWSKRKSTKGGPVIGRVHTVNPVAGDVYYLRMLLHDDHCKGKTGFDDLKVIATGRPCETYKSVCFELGLLSDDLEWNRILEESAVTRMCPQIRDLYIIILMFCEPSNPRQLYDQFWTTWCDDIEQKALKKGTVLTETQKETLVLLDLEMKLQSHEKTLEHFGLPVPTQEQLAQVETITCTESAVIREELAFDIQELEVTVLERVPNFTVEQSTIFNRILDAVKNGQPIQVFIDARGGCGKTYLLNTILAAVRSMEEGGCAALAMATTGIAANLLDMGRTYHSRMKAPLDPTEESTLQIPGK